MKKHLRRIPFDRRADLSGIDLDVVDALLLQPNRELEPDRARADDRNVTRLDHALSPISRKTATFASIIT